MQHYGLMRLWSEGDALTWMVAGILFLMSVLSWTVTIVKSWRLMRLKQRMRDLERACWQADTIEAGIEQLGRSAGPNHPLLTLALTGQRVQHYFKQGAVQDKPLMSEWMTRCLRAAIDEQLARLQNGLALLASIGATAPFVGLLGTVWGIYHALLTISVTGQTSIDRVAGPVGEALIMTACGLFVAIPAVLAYNMLVRGHKVIALGLGRFAHHLQVYLVTGMRIDPLEIAS
jgi:biopolymer transport protein ExbB